MQALRAALYVSGTMMMFHAVIATIQENAPTAKEAANAQNVTAKDITKR